MSHGSIRIAACLLVLIAISALPGCSRQTDTPQQAANASATEPLPEKGEGKAEDVETFAIGDLTGVALRDGALSFPNDGQTFAVGQPPEEVAALLSAAGLPTDELHLTIQPLLVKAGDRVLLFDTGAGTNMGPSAGNLLASMTAAGIDPQSVTDVFISHIHGDHAGGLIDTQGALSFPDATVHISSPEWTYLKELNAERAASLGLAQHSALVATITPKIAEFAPGADIIPGVVKAVEIRGHTPGHSGYLITSGQSSLLYIGDAMHHSIVSVQKPDWTIAFDGDAPTAEASRSDLLARSADSGQRIYAVHFPFPGVGRIERRADSFVWVQQERR